MKLIAHASRFVAARSVRLAVLALLAASPSAHALRPFDGTDADVAKLGSFELEAGVSQLRLGPQRQSSLPALVGNWGIVADTELVLEGVLDQRQGGVPAGEHSLVLDAAALSVKHVFRRGSLQDESGVSVATECSLLLPSIGAAPGTGFGCAAIASQRWDLVSVHLNAALDRTREHTNERTLSLIAEGSEDWRLRPVSELMLVRGADGSRQHSALLGAIYQNTETLAFDLGYRHADGSAGRANELRLGLTWSMP
jgi:hypothetical protein